MRLPYSYVVLRYVHDIVSGEFANVGVVAFAPGSQFLRGRFISDFRRLRAMFGEIDEVHLSSILQHLDGAFAASQLNREMAKHDLARLVQRVLPADDSSLQWSPQGGGVTEDPSAALDHLFRRFVRQHSESVTAVA